MGGLIDRFSQLSREQWIEGALWSTWGGSSIWNWTRAIRAYRQVADESSCSAEKSDRIWQASRHLFLKTCSAVSGLSMVVCWLVGCSVLAIGGAVSYVSAGGYWSSAIVSGSKIEDLCSELEWGMARYNIVREPSAKQREAFDQMRNLIALSMYTCFAAWAALSGLRVLIGGETLFFLADHCVYWGLCLLCAHVGTSFLQPAKRC